MRGGKHAWRWGRKRRQRDRVMPPEWTEEEAIGRGWDNDDHAHGDGRRRERRRSPATDTVKLELRGLALVNNVTRRVLSASFGTDEIQCIILHTAPTP